jgi:hypothetical protein
LFGGVKPAKAVLRDPSNPLYLLTDVYVGYRFADAQSFQDPAADETGSEASEVGAPEATPGATPEVAS